MLLPTALRARLAGTPGAAEPLPVERHPAAGAAPFRFVARPVRLPREHELFEDGDVQRHLYLQDVLTQVAEEPERSRVPEFTCQVAGCCQVFAALEDYQHHYNMLHGNACSLCSRAFPSGHLLDAHILEWHDSLFQILAERQDMYQCLVEGCPEKFKTSRDRKDHMVRFHLYPADFGLISPRQAEATRGSDAALGDEGDTMEVCSEPAASPSAPVGERRTYSHRVPSTICFGQGASRGLKAPRKETHATDRSRREEEPGIRVDSAGTGLLQGLVALRPLSHLSCGYPGAGPLLPSLSGSLSELPEAAGDLKLPEMTGMHSRLRRQLTSFCRDHPRDIVFKYMK